ncbi:MAG: elongation factor P hydroxylase [Porticoccaceae bacterium]|jgi:elongation factor P hydroxylase
MKGSQPQAVQLEFLFRETFFDAYNTLLLGGADEPLYQPANEDCPSHRIFYREDYFSSALHEIAHWCIAGEARRRRVDFGYWYNPDGRTLNQQRAFEQVEVKPQALEWLFSVAAGIKFRVSADNLSAGDVGATEPSVDFLDALRRQAVAYCNGELPPRPAQFISALAHFYGTVDALNPDSYQQLEL